MLAHTIKWNWWAWGSCIAGNRPTGNISVVTKPINAEAPLAQKHARIIVTLFDAGLKCDKINASKARMTGINSGAPSKQIKG